MKRAVLLQNRPGPGASADARDTWSGRPWQGPEDPGAGHGLGVFT
jgi:hypothetical protein